MADPETRRTSLERAWEALAKIIPPARAEEVDLAAADGRYLAEDIRAARSRPAGAGRAPTAMSFRPGLSPRSPPCSDRRIRLSARPLERPAPEGSAVRIDRGTPLPEAGGFARIEDTALVGTERVRIERLVEDGIEPRAASSGPGTSSCVAARGSAPRRACSSPRRGVERPRAGAPPRHDRPGGRRPCRPSGSLPPAGGSRVPLSRPPLEGIGFDVRRVGPIPDDGDEIRLALLRASERGIAIAGGGLGEGFRDRTLRAFRTLRSPVIAQAVAVDPGGSTALARGPTGPIAALPGDPYEAAIALEAVVLPALARGLAIGFPHLAAECPVATVLGERPGDAARILPVRWTSGAETAEPLRADLGSLARCGGLALIPTGAPEIPAGARGRILRAPA